ncbi:hypothetical protein [Tenacibaculum sp. 190524A02b]|uniref:DKNYY family protein n=1 Tax=Tenacibaculum vairaonense TaxID=3137860 RepID=A0ABM9PP08_9FLAO
MIYDYSQKPPVLVSRNKANAYFPDFYFADDTDLYFLYPKDKVIYNYSLGVFFKHVNGPEYENIAIRPIIKAEQMGNLIGYTQFSPTQLPTLYFQNGRLTLEHSNCRNIGWHPRRQGFNYAYGNILYEDVPNYKKGGIFNEEQFKKDQQAAKNNPTKDIRLIEIYYNDSDIIQRTPHHSRSNLILGNPPNFVLQIVNQFLAAKEKSPSPF